MLDHQKEFDKAVEAAKAMFGKRISGIIIHPLRFYFDAGPVLNYTAPKEFTPIFNEDIIDNDVEFIFQAAHESVHTLGPPENPALVTMLEEGLATFFQVHYTHYLGVIRDGKYPYRKAFLLAEKLLASDPNIIKEVRKTIPRISNIIALDLIKTNPAVDKELAIEITKLFYK